MAWHGKAGHGKAGRGVAVMAWRGVARPGWARHGLAGLGEAVEARRDEASDGTAWLSGQGWARPGLARHGKAVAAVLWNAKKKPRPGVSRSGAFKSPGRILLVRTGDGALLEHRVDTRSIIKHLPDDQLSRCRSAA